MKQTQPYRQITPALLFSTLPAAPAEWPRARRIALGVVVGHAALRCRPDCRVERAPIGIDRVGFIRVPAPHPSDPLIWNSYEGW